MKTTLTEIIEILNEANENCEYDIKSCFTTNEEKLLLAIDLSLLRNAIGILTQLHERGSEQFFSGSIKK